MPRVGFREFYSLSRVLAHGQLLRYSRGERGYTAKFEAKLAENIRAFVGAVSKAKPAGAKGTYMKKINLSSTMGPGVSVAVENATAE